VRKRACPACCRGSKEPDVRDERDVAAATPAADASQRTSVQQAVEQFVELHSTGAAPDAKTFAARFTEDLRPLILAQVREFLAFDGLLGHQEWSEPAAPKDGTAVAGSGTEGADVGGSSGGQIGRVFGDFLIQEELGRGGMGVVYLAQQRSLHRRVALKVMAAGLTLSKRHVERFRREAAAAAQLRHPAIVAVHALAEVDGTFALAMDYVAGRNLADILDDLRLQNGAASSDEADAATKRKPLAVEGTLGLAPEKGYVAECAMFVVQLASGLAAAHQAGIVHRDLKPRNLMLDDRRQVRLLDFGLAKSLGEGSISMSGEITGTAHYMSPEQTLAKRVAVDHRADIWALGVILYEMLTLQRPFDGRNLQQVVYEICFREPLALTRKNPKVPRDLATICQKALEKDPQNRYQTAAEFEADLQRFLRWEPIHAEPAGPMTRLAKWTRRHRTETTIAALLAAGCVVLLAIGFWRGQRADQLLRDAEQVAEAGKFEDACALAEQALALRNDAATRERLRAYGEAGKRIEAETAVQAGLSRELIERDRELAIQVALAADQRHTTALTRSTVLAALGSGQTVRTLRADGDTPAPGGLRGIASSADGRLVATCGYADGAIRLWDPATGALRAVLQGHRDKVPVAGIAFCGDVLWSASTDQTLRSWQLPAGTPLRTLSLPGAAARLDVDQASTRALVSCVMSQRGEHRLQAFDLVKGEAIGPPFESPQVLAAAAFSACGNFAACCRGSHDTLAVWRTVDGTAVRVPVLEQPQARVRFLAFAPDRAVLAVAVDRSVLLYDLATGTCIGRAAHSGEVTTLAFEGKGQRLLSGSRDGTARVWELPRDGAGALAGATAALREVATLLGHTGSVERVAFAADGLLALTATGSQAGELRLFDVAPGRTNAGTAVRRYEVGPSIESVALLPDGRGAVALAGRALAGRARALVWDFTGDRGVVTMRQPGEVPAVAFAPNGDWLFTAGDDRRLRAWSCKDGRHAWIGEPFERPLQRLAVAPNGETLATTTTSGDVHLVRGGDGAPLRTLAKGLGPQLAVCFVDDGRTLLLFGNDGDRGVVRSLPSDGGAAAVRVTLTGPLLAGDVGPDGRTLATIVRDSAVVQLWTLPASGDGAAAPRAELRTGQKGLTSVHFAGQDTVLVAARDGSIVQLHLDGRELARCRGDLPVAFAIAAPDGEHLVTGGAEAHLWRLGDRSDHLWFRGHRASVVDAAWSPDGAWLATCSADGTTCIWPRDPVATARRLPLRTPTDAERQKYGLPGDPAPR
jgi:serine/threonine protein kinase/WD40 repeat protein